MSTAAPSASSCSRALPSLRTEEMLVASSIATSQPGSSTVATASVVATTVVVAAGFTVVVGRPCVVDVLVVERGADVGGRVVLGRAATSVATSPAFEHADRTTARATAIEMWRALIDGFARRG